MIVAVWGSISGETKSLAEFAARSRHNKYCKYIVIVQTLLIPIIIFGLIEKAKLCAIRQNLVLGGSKVQH